MLKYGKSNTALKETINQEPYYKLTYLFILYVFVYTCMSEDIIVGTCKHFSVKLCLYVCASMSVTDIMQILIYIYTLHTYTLLNKVLRLG